MHLQITIMQTLTCISGMGFWGMKRRRPSGCKTSSAVLKRREMAGFAGYLSASFTTQKIQMVCFLYFYLGEWLFRGSEMNRTKDIGLMVSATILFLFYGHVSNGNAHNKDEAQRNES